MEQLKEHIHILLNSVLLAGVLVLGLKTHAKAKDDPWCLQSRYFDDLHSDVSEIKKQVKYLYDTN